MPGIWTRHPRYTLLVLAVLVTTLYLLNTYQETPTVKASRYIHDAGLSARLQRADAIYEKTLRDRKGLIKMFGPSSSDIMMYGPVAAVLDYFTYIFIGSPQTRIHGQHTQSVRGVL